MRVLAIIPARQNSKRLRLKNFKEFGGKPLFMHTVDKLKKIKSINRIVISTDNKKITKYKLPKKAEIILRNKKLSNDKSSVLDVVIDIAKRKKNFDFIGYFLPTCPFIALKDIKFALKKLKKYDSVISILPFEDPIQIALKLNKKTKVIKPIFNNLNKNKINSRYIEKSYKPSGGFYFINKKKLLLTNKIYFKKTYGVLYTSKKYIDIDTLENFQYAKYLLKQR